MKISLAEFGAIVKKVALASGKADSIMLVFAKREVKEKVCGSLTLTAYDGKGLQIMKGVGLEEAPENDATVIVRASALTQALALYEGLGTEEIELIVSEKALTVKDKSGETELPRLESMDTISTEVLREGKRGSFVVSVKAFAEALKSAAAFCGKAGGVTEGICFQADESGKKYEIYATDGHMALRRVIETDIEETAPSTDEGAKPMSTMCFVALPQLGKISSILSGDVIKVVLSGGYLSIVDSSKLLVAVSLSTQKFPSVVQKSFVVKEIAGSIELPKGQLEQAVDLVTLQGTPDDAVPSCTISLENGTGTGIAKIYGDNPKNNRTLEGKINLSSEKKIGLNARYLKQALASCSTQKVRVDLLKGQEVLYLFEEKSQVPFVVILGRKTAQQ